jgi:hypothetical protein
MKLTFPGYIWAVKLHSCVSLDIYTLQQYATLHYVRATFEIHIQSTSGADPAFWERGGPLFFLRVNHTG